MIKIGITGSVASGKTTASKIIASKQGPLFSADKVVKKLYTQNKFKKLIAKKLNLKLMKRGASEGRRDAQGRPGLPKFRQRAARGGKKSPRAAKERPRAGKDKPRGAKKSAKGGQGTAKGRPTGARRGQGQANRGQASSQLPKHARGPIFRTPKNDGF